MLRRFSALVTVFACLFLALRFSAIVLIEEASHTHATQTPYARGFWAEIYAAGEPNRSVISQDKYLRRFLYCKDKSFVPTPKQALGPQYCVYALCHFFKPASVSAEPLFSFLRSPPLS